MEAHQVLSLLYMRKGDLRKIFEGSIERIGLPKATLHVKGLDQADNFSKDILAGDQKVAVGILMDWIEKRIGADALTAVGHRMVQGGPKYSEPQLITKEILMIYICMRHLTRSIYPRNL
jgi:acetate kinase